jgi:quinol monooxygenase YgiN/catechol 2,3-dioxygenase-like lactoylglutathione lyase family enzyme
MKKVFLTKVSGIMAIAVCTILSANQLMAQISHKSLSGIYQNDTQKNPYVIIATVEIKEEYIDYFLKETLPLIKASRNEEGLELYQFHQSNEELGQFSWYEHFKNKEAFEVHTKSIYVSSWLKKLERITKTPLTVTPYKMIEEKVNSLDRASETKSKTISPFIKGVQHVGVTVSNISRAYEFYTQVLGGVEIMRDGDFKGETMHNTLLQVDELKSKSKGVEPSVDGVPNLRGGTQRLDVVFIQFPNVVIELLQYRNANQKEWTEGTFVPIHSSTSPAFPTNMHISFEVSPEIDFDKFLRNIESESHKRGMLNVKCNRIIDVKSEDERLNAPISSSSFKIKEGASNGWSLCYCKGPEGEQFEFNQVKEPVKSKFKKTKY